MSINCGMSFLRKQFENSHDLWSTGDLQKKYSNYYSSTDSIRIALDRLRQEGLVIHETKTTWRGTGKKSKIEFMPVETPTITPPTAKDAAAIRKAFDSAVNEIISRHHEERPRKKVALEKESTSALIVLSDFHHGEVVPGVYDMSISEGYLRGIIEKSMSLIGLENAKNTIDEVIIAMNGDMVDGDCVFDAQWNSIEDCAFGQYQSIVPILLTPISYIKKHHKHVKSIRYVMVYGNHGKVAANGAAKPNNWDNIVYETIRTAIEHMPDDNGLNISVEFNPRSDVINFEVRGHRFMMRHWCPRYLETPAGQRYLANWKDKHGFNAAIFGHWHTSEKRAYGKSKIYRNGAAVPTNDYADSLALDSEPAQWLLGITETCLPTFSYEMNFKKGVTE